LFYFVLLLRCKTVNIGRPKPAVLRLLLLAGRSLCCIFYPHVSLLND